MQLKDAKYPRVSITEKTLTIQEVTVNLSTEGQWEHEFAVVAEGAEDEDE